MKKLLSVLLVLALALALLPCAAFADSDGFGSFSDAELKQLYEAIRQEMQKRGLSTTKELTLREGKYIVGQDIEPGSYTLKCVETSGESYGDLYSSLGNFYGGQLGDLMGSLGGMVSNVINTEAKIIGDYGTVLKSFELKAGDSVRLTLEKNTALEISEGTCTLTAD